MASTDVSANKALASATLEAGRDSKPAALRPRQIDSLSSDVMDDQDEFFLNVCSMTAPKKSRIPLE